MSMSQGLSRAVQRLAGQFDTASAAMPEPIGEPRPGPLTVGIATYDDYDGVFFSVKSLLLHHPEVMKHCEILILDNHPRGPESAAVADLAQASVNSATVRYLPYEKVQSTAVRDVLFREAAGDVVLVIDSHVLLASGALTALLDYYRDSAHSKDMVQGPLLAADSVGVAATHMDPRFQDGMYGVWGTDPRGLDPSAPAFEIQLHGLGAFAMRKDAWPGISPAFRGFGGEEGYIQERVRQAGGRVVCLPALRWLHRFQRPAGVPYANRYMDRLNNYLVGWEQIGYDPGPVLEHFSDLIGPSFYVMHEQVQAHLEHPLRFVDGAMVLSDDDRVAPWSAAQESLAAADIPANRAVVPSGAAFDTRIRAALRDALLSARQRGWTSVLLLDEHWRLDLGLAHAVRNAAEKTDEPVVLFASENDELEDRWFLPGPLLVRSIDDARGALEPEPSSVRQWVHACGGSVVSPHIPLAVPAGTAHAPLAAGLSEGHVGSYVEESAAWLSTYRGYASWGLGANVHRMYLLDREGQSQDDAFVAAVVQRLDVLATNEAPPTPVLFSYDNLKVLAGARQVMDRVLSEAAGLDWDVLCLCSEPGAEDLTFLPGRTTIGSRRTGNSGMAFLVHPDAIGRVADSLRRETRQRSELGENGRLNGVLDGGTLRVCGIEPGIVSRADVLRAGSAETKWRHRFEGR